MLAINSINPDPVITAVSHDKDPARAAKVLFTALNQDRLSIVLFFCSTDYDLEALSTELGRYFGDTPVVGCTTAGEITPLGYSSGSITGIGFCADYFSIQSALVKNLTCFTFADAQRLVHKLIDDVNRQQVAPIKGHTFVLSLLDGLSIREEQLLSVLKANLGSIPLLGGSAGDDLHLKDTHVYYDGHFHSDAAILIMVNTRCDFEVFSIHHLVDTPEKLVITEADNKNRRVVEFNAVPAAQEYAETLGLNIEELNSLVFALNPLSVRIGERYYPRAIQKVNEDLSLSFYCAVETGVVLTRSKPQGLMEELESLFLQLRSRLGDPKLIIGYDCIFRRLEIEHHGLVNELSSILSQNRVIGFNTYGEQFDGMHLNQTFTGVALGGVRFE
ncbi:nitric oxide-sensing protein NosP [Motiliproteus sp. MSK22-1]|uniref:nitric oxide-sensing protein NosP n=1 Tax=Motiliproteus sp. MSK22-1 TaxID=1897630 RepID=UPI00268F6DBE